MGGIRLEFELPAPPERVWPLLTDRRHLAVWFTETDFVPEPGQRFMIWPGQQMAGVDGPISAIVLTITPPEKLVMGWQSPLSQTTMTWTLQATRHGSRLRVVEWGHVGDDEVVREQVLSRLFDVGLRALVEREVAVPAGGVAMPVMGQPAPAASAMAAAELTTPPAVPASAAGDPDPPRRRRRWLVLLAVLILLLLLAGLGVYLIWPPDPAGGGVLSPPNGRAGLGSSSGSASSRPGHGTAVGPGVTMPGRNGGPPAVGPIAGVTPGPSATQPGSTGGMASAPLTVRTSQAGSLLNYLVTVSLTNNGDTTDEWRSVGIVLNGLNVVVTPQSSDVSYIARGGSQCFTPTTQSIAAVAPHTTYDFIINVTLSVNVSGALIKSVALDSSPCVSAG
jgi:uncharacterized protein YndB with AHSA1/START domain